VFNGLARSNVPDRMPEIRRRTPTALEPQSEQANSSWNWEEAFSSSGSTLLSLAIIGGIMVGSICPAPAMAATIEEKTALEEKSKSVIQAANEMRQTMERDAVVAEAESIKATVELKKKAEKEIEERVNIERAKQVETVKAAKVAAAQMEADAARAERDALKGLVDLKKVAEKEIEDKVRDEVAKIYDEKKAAFAAAEEVQTEALRKISADKAAAIVALG